MQKITLFALSVFFIFNTYNVGGQIDIDSMLVDIEQSDGNLDSVVDLYTRNLSDLSDSLVLLIFQNLEGVKSQMSEGQILEVNKRQFERLGESDRAEVWKATIKLLENRVDIDSSKLAFAINSLGEWYAHIKEKELAKEQFIKVIGLYPENSLELELGYSYNNLGTILNVGGDPGAGIPFMEQAIRVFSHHLGEDHQYISVMFNNIGMAYGNLKQRKKQKEFLLKSYRIRSAKYDACHSKMFEVRHNLALCLTDLKEYDEASQFVYDAMKCLDSNTENANYQYVKLQTILVSIEINKSKNRGNLNLESLYLESIKSIEEKAGKYHHAAKDIYNNTGVFYYEKDRAKEAVKFLEMAVKSLIKDKADTTFILPKISQIRNISREDLVLFTNLGSSYFNLFNESNKRSYLDQSYEVFLLCDQIAETLKIRILQGDSRDILKEDTRHSFIMSNRTAHRLFKVSKEEKYKEKLFENAEKIKSWELLEKYSYTNQAADLENSEVESRINQIKNKLLLGEQSNLSDSLKTELNFLLQQLKIDYPEQYRNLYGNQTITLDQLQDLCVLDQSQWIVYYQLPKNKFGSLYINKDTTILSANLYSSIDLIAAKELLFEKLDQKNWDFVQSSKELYNLLIRDHKPYLKGGHLVLQLHQQILDLPFELLIDPSHPDNSTLNDFSYRYLIHDFDISYMHSASIAFQLKNRRAKFTSPFFYAPDYENDELRLEWNNEEVKSGSTKIGGDAQKGLSKVEFLEYLNIKDHLHFAGHVYGNERIDSTFILLDRDSLFLNEIVNQNSEANLLVLSGCNSGIGKTSSEALISPAYSFTFAGSPNIISSLWKTRDESSHKIFDRFYYHLGEGLSSVSSLRQAKIDYLAEVPIPERHPIYWASFTHYGIKVYYESELRNIKRSLFAIAGIALIAGLMILKMRSSGKQSI